MSTQLLIVGDVMLDLYTWGRAERLSPEAPVLVLAVEREEARLGGAGAVAALAAGLGTQPRLVGIIGDDPAGRIASRLVAELGHSGIGNREQRIGNRDEEHAKTQDLRPKTSDLNPKSKIENPKSLNGLGSPSSANLSLATCSLFPTPDRPTTVKERLIGTAAGRHGQQMLRVDRESRRPLPHEIEEQLRRAAVAALDRVQAVLISDYGKGVCTPGLLSALIRAARRRRLPVLVDPRRGGDFGRYQWATIIKPNRREASEATGIDIRCVADAFVAGQALCARGNFQAAVITLDADGLVLVTADGEERHFATSDREVCDVTGAGDTVLAVLGRSLALGLSLAEACELANLAAGLQVEHLGVAPLTWEAIEGSGFRVRGSGNNSSVGNGFCAVPRSVGNGLCAVPRSVGNGLCAVPRSVGNGLCAVPRSGEHQEDGLFSPSRREGDGLGRPTSGEGHNKPGSERSSPTPNTQHPIPSPSHLQASLDSYRAAGQTIVFTNGCFDLLHAGHLHCLAAAKALGDVLIVGLNSDAGVRRLKGNTRPIVCQRDRAAMLAALDCVDHVVIFHDDTPERLIADLRPDVLVKGAEARPGPIPGANIVASYGGRVALVPLLPGISTTAILERFFGTAKKRHQATGARRQASGVRRQDRGISDEG